MIFDQIERSRRGYFLQFMNVKENRKRDEIRMGDTFASVVPIPESSPLALLAAVEA